MNIYLIRGWSGWKCFDRSLALDNKMVNMEYFHESKHTNRRFEVIRSYLSDEEEIRKLYIQGV